MLWILCMGISIVPITDAAQSLGLLLPFLGLVYLVLVPAFFAAFSVQKRRRDAEMKKQDAVKRAFDAAQKTKKLIRNGRKDANK